LLLKKKKKPKKRQQTAAKPIFFFMFLERQKDGAGYLLGSQPVVLICVHFIYSFFFLSNSCRGLNRSIGWVIKKKFK